jgi:hypothetical protein
MRRALALALAAAACAGCASAGGATRNGSTGAHAAAAQNASGNTITTEDGRVYTVASSGEALRLDDLSVRLVRVTFTRHAAVGVAPAGTTTYARATLRLRNTSKRRQVVRDTQIWMLDGLGHTFLAARAKLPQQLLGRALAPGQAALGTIVFPLPARRSATSLLVYRFADGRAIAHAKHMGLLRLPQ